MIFSPCVREVFVVEQNPGSGTQQLTGEGLALRRVLPREGAGSMKGSRAAVRMMPEGGVRPVLKSCRGAGPCSVPQLLPSAAGFWGLLVGEAGEEGRDGTLLRIRG